MRELNRRLFLGGALAVGAGEAVVYGASAAHPALHPSPWRRPVVFSEEFNTLSVSARGPGSRWIAHTPWNGDFGDAAFADPEPDFPFRIDNGVLSIEARRNAEGRWRAGLLSSTDAQGAGFSQKYGYFEARMKLPAGPGVWPAFWLVSVPGPGDKVEIDVVEYYGVTPTRFSSASHVWPKDKSRKPKSDLAWTQTREPLAKGWRTFGVCVSPQALEFYLDRCVVKTLPCPPEHDRPLGILVNLALGSGWPIQNTPNPSRLLVDYVRAHALA